MHVREVSSLLAVPSAEVGVLRELRVVQRLAFLCVVGRHRPDLYDREVQLLVHWLPRICPPWSQRQLCRREGRVGGVRPGLPQFWQRLLRLWERLSRRLLLLRLLRLWERLRRRRPGQGVVVGVAA